MLNGKVAIITGGTRGIGYAIAKKFLENNDFTGKTIILFCTHGGSGLSGTVHKIKNKLTSANVITNGFNIYRSNIDEAPNKIDSWLETLGIN